MDTESNSNLAHLSTNARSDSKKALSGDVGGYELAEEITGICRGTLYHLVHQKRIPHVRLSARMVRFRRSDLVAWMNDQAVPVRDVNTADEGRGA